MSICGGLSLYIPRRPQLQNLYVLTYILIRPNARPNIRLNIRPNRVFPVCSHISNILQFIFNMVYNPFYKIQSVYYKKNLIGNVKWELAVYRVRRPPGLKSGYFFKRAKRGIKVTPLPIENTILIYVLPIKLISTLTLCHSSN